MIGFTLCDVSQINGIDSGNSERFTKSATPLPLLAGAKNPIIMPNKSKKPNHYGINQQNESPVI